MREEPGQVSRQLPWGRAGSRRRPGPEGPLPRKRPHPWARLSGGARPRATTGRQTARPGPADPGAWWPPDQSSAGLWWAPCPRERRWAPAPEAGPWSPAPGRHATHPTLGPPRRRPGSKAPGLGFGAAEPEAGRRGPVRPGLSRGESRPGLNGVAGLGRISARSWRFPISSPWSRPPSARHTHLAERGPRSKLTLRRPRPGTPLRPPSEPTHVVTRGAVSRRRSNLCAGAVRPLPISHDRGNANRPRLVRPPRSMCPARAAEEVHTTLPRRGYRCRAMPPVTGPGVGSTSSSNSV